MRKPLLIVLALGCLIAAGVVAVRTMSTKPARSGAQPVWQYAADTGELAIAPYDPAAITARVFGCGGCDEAQRFVGFLEKVEPEDKRFVAAPPEVGETPQWLPAEMPQASDITNVSQRCENATPRACYP